MLPYRSTSSTRYLNRSCMLSPVMPQLVPWVAAVSIRQRLEGAVKRESVPNGAAVDELWAGHTAVADQGVKQARTNADISGGLDARHAAGRVQRLSHGRPVDRFVGGVRVKVGAA